MNILLFYIAFSYIFLLGMSIYDISKGRVNKSPSDSECVFVGLMFVLAPIIFPFIFMWYIGRFLIGGWR